MKSKIHILCPEYVPLENKGEEAIIRGTIDVIFESEDCEYHIVDNNSKKYYRHGNIHVHPGNLFFSDWRTREFGLGPSWRQVYSSACSLLRNGLNKFFPWWILKPHREARNLALYLNDSKKVPRKHKESIELLKNVEYIIAGHNGGLNENVCHCLIELSKIDKRFGIFGSCLKPNVKDKGLLEIYRRTFEKSEFNIVRNPLGINWTNRNFKNLNFVLKPDPAFGMIATNISETKLLIKKLGLDLFFSKPVLMITTAEPAPIARHSFDEVTGTPNKIKTHRKFLAELLLKILSFKDFNVLFLPHTIGPDRRMDDRLISEDIISLAGVENNPRIKLLKDDLSARQLKGIIREAEFLLAERLHSIIGGIGVNTPFMSLASKEDNRIEGILNQQLKLGNFIYYLNKPTVEGAFTKFKELYEQREKSRILLKEIDSKLIQELKEIGNAIKNQINHIQ